MDTSHLHEIAKSRPINIFHLEDEDDWTEVFQDNILSEFSLNFKYHHCETIDELKENLSRYPDLPILIADLKLAEPLEDVQGLAWVLRNIDALRNNQVEVFVLSGFLRGPSRSNRFLLEYNQLPDNHLYSKAQFDEDQFLEVLEDAAERLLKASIEPWENAPSNSIFAIDACMVNVNLVEDVYQVQQEKTYFVDVEITALTGLSPLARKCLKVYVYSLEAKVSPATAELQIPKNRYSFNYKRFEISFKIEEAPLLRDMFVAVFYGNNLLRLFEMRVNIERARGNETNSTLSPIIREYM